MSIPKRGVALTAIASQAGIVVYLKTEKGGILSFRNSITNKQLYEASQHKYERISQDILGHSIMWEEDIPSLICDPRSTLCGVAWDSYSESIFYQDSEGFICEWQKLYDSEWPDFDTRTPLKGLMGTNIAVVHGCNGNRIMLFYQDEEHYICCASAHLRQWGRAVRLANATPHSGIGATSWKNLEEVRIYFQDETLSICEYGRSSISTEQLTRNTSFSLHLDTKELIADITAISSEVGSKTNIRIYFRSSAGNIVEYFTGENGWDAGSLAEPCHLDTIMTAVSRNIVPNIGFCINVFWVGQDRKLYQRVYDFSYSDWRSSYELLDVSSVENVAGSSRAKTYKDPPVNADHLFVRMVQVRVLGAVISAIALEFVDGTKTCMHGGDSGDIHSFQLKDGEEIIYMSIVPDECRGTIQGLCFGTSNGRESEWYGSQDRSRGQWWEKSGQPLIGFAGAADNVLRALRPLWAERPSCDDFSRPNKVFSDAYKVDNTIRDAGMKHGELIFRAEEFTKGTHKVLGDHMNAVVTLARSIEYLNDLTHPTNIDVDEERKKETISQCVTCHTEAGIVEDALQTVFKKNKECKDYLDEFDEECHKISSSLDIEKVEGLIMKITSIRNIHRIKSEELRKTIEGAETRMNDHRRGLPEDSPNGDSDAAREKLGQAQNIFDTSQECIRQLVKSRQLAEGYRASAQEMRGRMKELFDALPIYSRAYGDCMPLGDTQDVQVLAKNLLDLVMPILTDPYLEGLVGSAQHETKKMQQALRSIAGVGN